MCGSERLTKTEGRWQKAKASKLVNYIDPTPPAAQRFYLRYCRTCEDAAQLPIRNFFANPERLFAMRVEIARGIYRLFIYLSSETMDAFPDVIDYGNFFSSFR